jgi:uncharacterized membrane protein
MKESLLLIGLAVVLVGFALVVFGSMSQANVSTGGFILIGPFPIVFGTGGSGGQLALLSVVVGVILVVMTALWARRLHSADQGPS